MNLIGWDCAVDAQKNGVAVGCIRDNRITVDCVQARLSRPALVETLCDAVRGADRVLLAIDSPLGWPTPLGHTLARHVAGESVKEEADQLVRRETDRVIERVTGKRPLDVGADRIARTAIATLKRLTKVRERTHCALPLAWNPERVSEPCCIEVYPAATLKTRGWVSAGYKNGNPDHKARRAAILADLAGTLDFSTKASETMLENADALDAVICLLAARDFLLGRVMPPEDGKLARKEGWIWVRGRERGLR